EDDVLARLVVHDDVGAGQDAVLIQTRRAAVIEAIAVEEARPGAVCRQDVDARPAAKLVIAGSADQAVAGRAAVNRIGRVRTDDALDLGKYVAGRIAVRLACWPGGRLRHGSCRVKLYVDAARGGRIIDRVESAAADERVRAGTTAEEVVAIAA